MTLRDLEATAARAHLAVVVIRDGKPTFIDLDDSMMAEVFAPVMDAVEAGERELMAAYSNMTGGPAAQTGLE